MDAATAWPTIRADGAPSTLALEPGCSRYETEIVLPDAAGCSIRLWSPRPLRVWIAGVLALDEDLSWRSFQRQVEAAVLWPAVGTTLPLRFEMGERPTHHRFVDESCPSRNREAVLKAVREAFPDELRIEVAPASADAPALALRFLPAQFWRDGILWQHLTMRPVHPAALRPPSTVPSVLEERKRTSPQLRTAVAPVLEISTSVEVELGYRRYAVPVATAESEPAPLRAVGQAETRPEPRQEMVGSVRLEVGDADVDMPVFEPLGRLAPQRSHAPTAWPSAATLLQSAPEPVLPPEWAHLGELYQAGWDMLVRLARQSAPESGLPGGYLCTGANFTHYAFVWDTAFAAMTTAYAHRSFPVHASLDVLYSRQFDGGYIHRQHDVRDGSPSLFEPDFSPNPPIMAVAEWAIANLTGDRDRLARVYPALEAHHRWLSANRRLPDGTFWTTGLASGLDNSPSLGEGYPDLTAQMAHHAQVLGEIAGALGRPDEAQRWRREQAEIAAALNARLWNSELGLYTTSLPEGGHHPNKIITGFWPLWAGLAPPERAASVAAHARDKASFWRHHPFPSLAADSPDFRPEGRYWLGSVWPPTNYVAIGGLHRAGFHDLAREAASRHLDSVSRVLRDTGSIWENYTSEGDAPGSLSGRDYCWSALGPVNLLLEVVIGLTPRALHNQLRWRPPPDREVGVRRYPLGAVTIDLMQTLRGGERRFTIETDAPFELVVETETASRTLACPPGRTDLVL